MIVVAGYAIGSLFTLAAVASIARTCRPLRAPARAARPLPRQSLIH